MFTQLQKWKKIPSLDKFVSLLRTLSLSLSLSHLLYFAYSTPREARAQTHVHEPKKHMPTNPRPVNTCPRTQGLWCPPAAPALICLFHNLGKQNRVCELYFFFKKKYLPIPHPGKTIVPAALPLYSLSLLLSIALYCSLLLSIALYCSLLLSIATHMDVHSVQRRQRQKPLSTPPLWYPRSSTPGGHRKQSPCGQGFRV